MNANILTKIKNLCDKDDKNSAATLAEIKKLVKNADYPDFSTIKDGDHFEYRGHEWVRLGREGGGILCVVAKESKDTPFNPDNDNDWRKSAIRKALNTQFIKTLDEDKLIPYASDLVADNGDDRYGKCEDKVFILSCDLIRKYRKVLPKWKNWVWTLTPWYINDSGYGHVVRIFSPSGTLNYGTAYVSYGVAPACIFIEES